jgi:hypothetical protein
MEEMAGCSLNNNDPVKVAALQQKVQPEETRVIVCMVSLKRCEIKKLHIAQACKKVESRGEHFK